MSSRMCAFFSATGILFMSWVGILLMHQPFFVGGISNVDRAKSSAFGAAGCYFFCFLVSVWYMIRGEMALATARSTLPLTVMGFPRGLRRRQRRQSRRRSGDGGGGGTDGDIDDDYDERSGVINIGNNGNLMFLQHQRSLLRSSSNPEYGEVSLQEYDTGTADMIALSDQAGLQMSSHSHRTGGGDGGRGSGGVGSGLGSLGLTNRSGSVGGGTYVLVAGGAGSSGVGGGIYS